MMLFITQTGLVAANRRDIHRKLGWWGAGLAVAMLILLDGGCRFLAQRAQPRPQHFAGVLFYRAGGFARGIRASGSAWAS